MPLVKTNALLLYFFFPQWVDILLIIKSMALNISPPAFSFFSYESDKSTTFLTNYKVGFAKGCSSMLFPSSDKLSPNKHRLISCVELLNIFCCKVNLKHSIAIFNLEATYENFSSIELPLSTVTTIASFDILINIIKTSKQYLNI